MQQLFYENYEQNKKGYIRDLHSSKIHGAITLHPNKSPPHQYRLHSYLLSRRIAELRHRTLQLHRELVLMGRYGGTTVAREDLQLGLPPSFTRFQPRRRDEVLDWDFLTAKHLYSAADGQPPRRGLDAALRAALDDVVQQVMELINANAKARGRVIDFKEIQYGYRRVDPLHGAEYVLDLLLLYKKHKGKKLAVPVRRHAYLQQSFSRPHLLEHDPLDARELAAAIDREADAAGSLAFLSDSLKRLVPFPLPGAQPSAPRSLPHSGSGIDATVHILVPLAGRLDMFARFLAHVERTCLAPGLNVQLVVLLSGADANPDRARQLELLRESHRRHPHARLLVLPVAGPFSRARALEAGAAHLSNDSLLFFCDVDLAFTAGFLQRCRSNAVAGQQAYFPVIFSQYDPRVVYGDRGGRAPGDSPFAFTRNAGFWRHHGFGIACIYRGDLARAGGFDVSIQGWGLEDVDLFSKVVRAGLRPFRSPEVGVVHLHHPVTCDPQLEPRQYRMCLGSKAATYGSTQQLAELWLQRQGPGANGSRRSA